ncbi:DUF4191 domain-containing protein [Arcanobacterium pinnipediorum]|uniref:DUF4191 domain-containing protein n=1 Tax=Arcanobacterium pinnipediorum TaxID=1503041 RepID=A0ABY5AJ14_9ACTO|nr:DUF4191 domain-containing protein [Arcanobacterium pinnipediorum]USR80092.1 DUF4191 domain-containing protein [Arcanobacterium pinnipediorum]
MAKEQKNAKVKKAKKKRWYSYLHEAYGISKETYSWTPFAVFGPLLGGIALGVVIAMLTGRWILWPILFTLLAVTLSLYILVELVKRASYAKIEGIPGAAAAVLGQIKRGWIILQEPVRFNARTQDMVFRAIGRPGVVLITDGDQARSAKLANEERHSLRRIIPNVPVHIISAGNGSDQVPLRKLQRAMRKLPKQITNQEVQAVFNRLDAVKTNPIGIPKGIDPYKARPDRRGMRGR